MRPNDWVTFEKAFNFGSIGIWHIEHPHLSFFILSSSSYMINIHIYRFAIPVDPINGGTIHGNPWEVERGDAQPARHQEVHRAHRKVCPAIRLNSDWDKYWSCWLLTRTIHQPAVVIGTVQLKCLLYANLGFVPRNQISRQSILCVAQPLVACYSASTETAPRASSTNCWPNKVLSFI